MKIEKKINRWQKAGLLNSEQSQKILEFEKTHSKSRWSRIGLYGFVILGGCVLSIGIISLIAANWEDIPDLLKLTTAFLLLSGVGAAIYRAELGSKEIAFDALATIFVLGCLATIGLIAQIFHTGGQPHQALFFWLIVVLPLSALGKKMFLKSLWVVGLLVAFFTMVLNEHSWWANCFLVDGKYVEEENLFPIFLIVALGMMGLSGLCSQFQKLSHFSSNFWFWGLLAILSAVVAGDVLVSVGEQVSAQALYPVYILLPLSMWSIHKRKDSQPREIVMLGMLLLLAMFVYLPAVVFPSIATSSRFDWLFQLIGATYFLVSIFLMALYFSLRERFWLFNAMVIVMGIRFLVIYFQVFEDLAYTGVGLVVSGLLIIGLAMVWYKNRNKIEHWVKEWIK